jgi:hypothetical protein
MAKKIRLDFSKVEERSGWNTKEIPEGVHEMKIVSVEVGEAKDGTDMITYGLVPTNPKYKTRLFPYYCKLQQNQLFKIRDLLVAAGISVPKKVTSIDPEAPVGKIVAAEVSDETGQYAGRSSIDGIYDRSIAEDDNDAGDEPDDEVEDDEVEDEVDEEEDFDDEEDSEEEDDEDEDGDDELREEIEALTLPELRKRAKGLGIDTAGVKKDALIELVLEEELGDEDDEDEDDLDDEELEDEDLDDEEFEDDEDEEEEEPEPAPRKRPAARKPAAKAAAKPAAKTAVKRTVKRR